MRSKLPELRLALDGRLTSAQRFVVNELLDRCEEVEAAVARVDAQIEKMLVDAALGEAVELLQGAPGVGASVAQIIVSEIGVDMTRFPSDKSSVGRRCNGNW
jgi:transposase